MPRKRKIWEATDRERESIKLWIYVKMISKMNLASLLNEEEGQTRLARSPFELRVCNGSQSCLGLSSCHPDDWVVDFFIRDAFTWWYKYNMVAAHERPTCKGKLLVVKFLTFAAWMWFATNYVVLFSGTDRSYDVLMVWPGCGRCWYFIVLNTS